MMSKTYIGADNGVTACWCIMEQDKEPNVFKVPIKKEKSYTKESKKISRINTAILKNILKKFTNNKDVLLVLERPMINPRRWTASMSAIRALEATLIIIEELAIPYTYIDSKQWQSVFLPGIKGSEELKKASTEKAIKLYPTIKLSGDGDSVLIAEYARQEKL